MQISLLLALSSSIGFVLGAEYCVEPKPGFDAEFYTYPFGDVSTLFAGPFYFNGGYSLKGVVTATTHGITNIRAHQDADYGFIPTPEDGTVYGQDVSVTNFGVVLTGYFYAEQSGVYKFTLPADNSGIGIQFGDGMTSDKFNRGTDAVAYGTQQIAEYGEDSSDATQEVIDKFDHGLENVNHGNKAGSSGSSLDSISDALGSVKSGLSDKFIDGPIWYSTSGTKTYSRQMIQGQYYPVRVVYFHPGGDMDISLPWTMPNGKKRNDFNNVYQWEIETEKCHGPPQKTISSNTGSTSTESTSAAVSSSAHSNSSPGTPSISHSSQSPSVAKNPSSTPADTNSVTSRSDVSSQSFATLSSTGVTSTDRPSSTTENGSGSSSASSTGTSSSKSDNGGASSGAATQPSSGVSSTGNPSSTNGNGSGSSGAATQPSSGAASTSNPSSTTGNGNGSSGVAS